MAAAAAADGRGSRSSSEVRADGPPCAVFGRWTGGTVGRCRVCDYRNVQEVEVDANPIERLIRLLDSQRGAEFRASADRARALLAGRTVWNINATATGGGVAEMLQSLLAYGRGVGVDTRWLALDATPGFFHLTKRLHNRLHGTAGDGGPVDEGQRPAYEAALEPNLAQLRTVVRPGDIVLLHDPQTAGLAGELRRSGAHVVWRCHVGRDTPNEHTDAAWSFLRPYVEEAQELIFSRRAYAPPWLDADHLWVIPPSLDPFSPKNCDLAEADVAAALGQAGLVDLSGADDNLAFTRRDGSTGTVRRHAGLLSGGPPVPRDARVVLQVSRWDRLKDMAGVLRAFIRLTSRLPDDVYLMLVGPDTSGVGDDPEGAGVLEECRSIWRAQPVETRRRVHLCSLPMDDIDENAHLVNALQRQAAVVVQKSLVEGFGLTVTEPMWKAKAVVASRVGGIQDQIVHGESGLLLDDPSDLDAFGSLVLSVLNAPGLAERLGATARERVSG
jgi:trehalose synthase